MHSRGMTKDSTSLQNVHRLETIGQVKSFERYTAQFAANHGVLCV